MKLQLGQKIELIFYIKDHSSNSKKLYLINYELIFLDLMALKIQTIHSTRVKSDLNYILSLKMAKTGA
jgi:hypothetical protein